MVEATGFEPVTSCMPCKRSPGLSYAPTRAKIQADLGEPASISQRLTWPRTRKYIPWARPCQDNIGVIATSPRGNSRTPHINYITFLNKAL